MRGLGRSAWLALLVGLALRAGYAYYAQSHHFIPTTSDEYETIALNLLDRGVYASDSGLPTAHREPGFPFLIALVYKLCGGRQPWAVLGLNCLMSLATGLLILGLGRRLFGEKAALAALWVWMLYPQAVYYCGYFFRETLATLLITALVYSSLSWRDDRPGAGRRGAALGGLAAMAAALTNSGLLPAALFCAGGFFLLRLEKRERLLRLGLYLAPVFLGSALWMARNYAIFGRVILGATNGGAELYQALVVPPADLGTPRHTEILAGDATWQRYGGAPEAQRNAALIRASLRWIAGHPLLYASRAAAGVAKFWRLWPYPRRYDHAYWKLVLASLLFDGWLVPLGLWGLWRRRELWALVPAAPICVATTTLLYGFVHAVIRYRLPLMPAVCAFACAGVWAAVRRAEASPVRPA